MKQVINCILLILLSLCSSAQSLVPNGDFEYFLPCPYGLAQVPSCAGWRPYHQGTSDYFNSCFVGIGGAGVPANAFGYQFAASGQGYMGVYVWTASIVYGNNTNYKEYITRTMTPMNVGTTYEVSMSVSLADSSNYASSDLGILFYKQGPAVTLFSGNTCIPITPQVHFGNQGPFTDKTQWVRLTSYFTADSAYSNIVIGGFTPYPSMTVKYVGGNAGSSIDLSYYYIDSVVVKIAPAIINLFMDSLLCGADTFQVPYTLTNNTAFTGANIFTAQLSNASGSFANGVTAIGTKPGNTAGSINCVLPPSVIPGNKYRIRIVSSSPVDSSNINTYPLHIVANIPKPAATNNGPLCVGQTLDLFAGTTMAGINYKWSGPAAYSSTVQNPVRPSTTDAMTGDYVITVSLGVHCVQKDTVAVLIKPFPADRILTANSPVCAGQTLNLSASSSSAGVTYTWAGPNSFTSALKNVSFPNVLHTAAGKYFMTYELNGCSASDSINIVIKDSPTPITASANTPLCAPETLHLNSTSSTSGVTYTWHGPGAYADGTQNPERTNTNRTMSGRYKVVVTLNDCSVSDTVDVIINATPADVSIVDNAPLCLDDTLKLTAHDDSVNVAYTWSGPDGFAATGAAVSIPAFSKPKAGNYMVTASLGDCKKTSTVNIQFIDPNIELGNSEILCNGETKLLTIDINTATYLWQDGSASGEYRIDRAGKYWVQATTKCGITSDSIDVAYQDCECNPFVPTAFSPNNDGLNDKIAPILNCNASVYSFLIVNRYGQTVFKTTDPTQKWDGNFNGHPADMDTYFYMLQLTGPRGNEFFFKGDLALIR